MTFPERFSKLPEHAFPRLRALLADQEAGQTPDIDMTIGEPRHPIPDFVAEVLAAATAGFAKYPPNDGSAGLRNAIADWAEVRYDVALDPETQIMALNGTREGLFNAVLALCPETKGGKRPIVLMPNPFYQVYAVAALAAGAEPVYVPATAATGDLPDYAGLPPEVLDRTALAFLCSPANPQGRVAPRPYWHELLGLAERHGFRILSDECYSEIWRDTPPPGGLELVAEAGTDPERVIVFNSLSKRSNLPGLRSGFVAGGPECLRRIKQLRAYAGAPLPLPLQAVSEACWRDEGHVRTSRALYVEKYAIAEAELGDIDGFTPPEAGFFLWLRAPDGCGETAARKLWREAGVRVLPGGYLARTAGGETPGADHIRVAMVAAPEVVRDGLRRIGGCLYGLRRGGH
ncbi:MAG: aminotransferase class I/II-fold pyridoxal phosphate-dependent enzyme [Alkalilacustris sp.]